MGDCGGGMGKGKIAVGNYHSRVMRDLEIQPFPGCGKLSMSPPDEGLGGGRAEGVMLEHFQRRLGLPLPEGTCFTMLIFFFS